MPAVPLCSDPASSVMFPLSVGTFHTSKAVDLAKGYTAAAVCGRYSLTNPAGIPDRFRLPGLSEVGVEPRFNVVPTQTLPVIVGTSIQAPTPGTSG